MLLVGDLHMYVKMMSLNLFYIIIINVISMQVGGPGSIDLLEVALPLQTDDWCNSYYDEMGALFLPAIQFCAGNPGENKDSCVGDSGGPLVGKGNDGICWALLVGASVVVKTECIQKLVFIQIGLNRLLIQISDFES